MATTTYTSTREYSLDQQRMCDKCAHSYVVVWRVVASASDTVLFSHGAAQRRADRDADLIGLSKLAFGQTVAGLAWQRCPSCGMYSERDLLLISQSYSAYRRLRRLLRWATYGIGGYALLFGGLLCIGSLMEPQELPPQYAVPFGAVVLLFGTYLPFRMRRFGTEAAFRADVATLNDERRVKQWLQVWQKKGSEIQRILVAPGRTPDKMAFDAFNQWRYQGDPVSPAALWQKDLPLLVTFLER